MAAGRHVLGEISNETAIALLAKDVAVVKETTTDIKKQLSNFIDTCDEKFTDFNSRLVREETTQEDSKEDVKIVHKRVDKLTELVRVSILTHEKGCPSREATVQRLAKNSRPPKDTPQQIRKPDILNGSSLIPRWILWVAASVGIGIAAFMLVYTRFNGGFFN